MLAPIMVNKGKSLCAMAVIPSISSFSRAVAMQLRFFFVSDTNVRMISFAALGSSSEKAVRAEKSNEDESVCELSLVGACSISVPVSSKSVKSCRMACELFLPGQPEVHGWHPIGRSRSWRAFVCRSEVHQIYSLPTDGKVLQAVHNR